MLYCCKWSESLRKTYGNRTSLTSLVSWSLTRNRKERSYTHRTPETGAKHFITGQKRDCLAQFSKAPLNQNDKNRLKIDSDKLIIDNSKICLLF